MEKFIVRGYDREVVTLRLPSELLEKVDMIANYAAISRNYLIQQMIEFAIDNMDPPSNEK